MKPQFPRFSLLFLLMLLWVVSCKKDNTDPDPDTCKLSAIDRGNNNKHAYTYDASGRISQMAREFEGSGSGNISHFVHTFTYDAGGLLTKTTSTLEGKPDNAETYTYTNGRISKVTYTNADGSRGTNNITYNAAGQITTFSYESGDLSSDTKQYFKFNTDGVLTETGYTDLTGASTFYQVVYKPVGKVISPEQLLAKYGLPYDVLTGTSWSVAIGGMGSTYEVFVPDDKTGKLVSVGTGKTTVIKTNAKGYLTEYTSIDDTQTSSTGIFTLTDCN